ncbi:MAG TPA: hypothetical protein VES01_00335 [Dermatophilaceae bacterium]|nr:hypothetical protein [Dermatophilaceae bacterium]
MNDAFFEENPPPAWAVNVARGNLRDQGHPEPDAATLRRHAWQLLQRLERDVSSRPG